MPPLHTPVLDYGAESSPLLDRNGLEKTKEPPPEREPSLCLYSGSKIFL